MCSALTGLLLGVFGLLGSPRLDASSLFLAADGLLLRDPVAVFVAEQDAMRVHGGDALDTRSCAVPLTDLANLDRRFALFHVKSHNHLLVVLAALSRIAPGTETPCRD
jgi:hypothetical protein